MALQNVKHKLLKPVYYKNPDSPLFQTRITPGEEGDGLTFPHLSDVQINLLRRKRIIAEIKPEKPAAKDGK